MVAPIWRQNQEAVDVIKTALAAGLTNLPMEQILAVKEFIEHAGGVERACQAIESLESMNRAA